MTAACLYTRQAHWKKQTLLLASFAVLVAATFYSQSRGALLALGVAFGAYMITRKDRSWIFPGAILGLIGLIYLIQPDSASTKLIERGDGGRIDMYYYLIAQMEGISSFLFGNGLWAVDSAGVEQVGWNAHHPHSVVVGTFFHGGAISLILTLILVGLGAVRALAVFRATGDGTWLVLLSFGLTGQLVDGALPFSLLTLPRIEPILLLFPIAAASAVYCEYARVREDSQEPTDATERQTGTF